MKRLILEILKTAAIIKLKIVKPKIVGVTGTVGKSSFVYLLDLVCKSHFKTRATFKGNSETGLPLEILGLRDQLGENSILDWFKILFLLPYYTLKPDPCTLLIAEMGVDSPYEPKNMSYLLKIVKPNIGVFLNVSPAHTEQFAQVLKPEDKDNEEKLVEAIASEKGKIVTTLNKEDTAIINIDSPYIKDLAPQIKANPVTFGQSGKASFKFTDYRVSLEGTFFKYEINSKKYQFEIKNQVLFKEYGLTIAAVIAASSTLGISVEEAVETIKGNFHLPPGRFSILKGKKDSTILDSSYNSSPIALTSALTLLGSLKTNGKKIAVIGDMRELGDLEERAHREIAKDLAKNCDIIILVGPKTSQYTLPELFKLKFPKDQIHTFKTSLGVGDFINDHILSKDDLILVKGSQNTIFLETTVKELLKNPEDQSLLCRQSSFWYKTREKFFKEFP